MKAEIIAVGTELLMGKVVNTNAPFLARELNALGVDHYFETVVGDNPNRIQEVTRLAEQRSDWIIFSGGIGPTQDDLTKQTLAAYLGEELVYDSTYLKRIEAHYQKRHIALTDKGKQMAYTFKRGVTLENPKGQACGSAIKKKGHTYIFLPGFPHELKAMWRESVVPYLNPSQEEVMTSRYLNFYGIFESALADKLDDLIVHQENPTLAIYSAEGIVTVRLTAKGECLEANAGILEDMTRQILDRLAPYYFGEGYGLTPVKALLDDLMAKHQTLSFAESLTGGMAGERIVNYSGASRAFQGSLVAYTAEAKQRVIGVEAKTIESVGMVSEQCALEMAEKTRQRYQSDLTISFTGVAGPDEMEGHPAGTVFCGFAFKDRPTHIESYHLSGDRQTIRQRCLFQACFDVWKMKSQKSSQ